MNNPEGSFDRFWHHHDAAEAQRSAPDAALVSAQLATATAIMRLSDVMVDIRDRLEVRGQD